MDQAWIELAWMIGKNFILLLEMFVILSLGKVFFDLFIWVFYKKNADYELLNNDNEALGIAKVSFMGALAISSLSGIILNGEYFMKIAMLLINGVVVSIPALLVAGVVNDFGILYKVRNIPAIILGNKAVAIVEGASYVGTALILAGSMSSGKISDIAIWFLIGQVAMVMMAQAYFKVSMNGSSKGSSIDAHDQIESQANIACGTSLAGFIVGSAFIVQGAIRGPVTQFSKDIGDAAIYVAVGFIVMVVLRWILMKVLVGKHKLSVEICKDRNLNAGLIEASIFIITGASFNVFM
jgi:hypothetical protein